MASKLVLTLIFLFTAHFCFAQDNYEIQVYGSETVKARATMFELHSNFTTIGKGETINDGVVSTNDQWRETLEITQGVTDWFEIGAYLFTTGLPGSYGLKYVGDHIRPRVRIPEKWNWPVGLSLSTEIGYQRRQYCEDTWNWEIRPIIDKQWRDLYVAFNPAIEYSIAGLNHSAGPGFAPAVKFSYSFGEPVAVGFEYYGDIGAFKRPDVPLQQQHQLGLILDFDVSPEWEINFGYLFGLTPATDRMIAKLIIGRRVDWSAVRKKKQMVKTTN